MKISYQIKLLIIHDRFYIRLSYCGNFLVFKLFFTLLHMYTYLSIYSITLKILFRPIQVQAFLMAFSVDTKSISGHKDI